MSCTPAQVADIPLIPVRTYMYCCCVSSIAILWTRRLKQKS